MKRGTPEGGIYTRNNCTKDLNQSHGQRKGPWPPKEKQIPLEMGTGGGGGGKRGGGDDKRPPADKSEFEDYSKKDDDDDDSSTETLFELEVAPEQLASINPNRPILRLRMSPRKRVVTAGPGGGRTPPPGSATKTQPTKERTRSWKTCTALGKWWRITAAPRRWWCRRWRFIMASTQWWMTI